LEKYDSVGTSQGVIGFELMISHEIEKMTEEVDLGENGRIFLAALDGTPVVHLKDDAKPPIQTPALTEAINSGQFTGITTNEMGTEVIGFYLKNDQYPWVMIAEVESAEAFQGVTEIKSFFTTSIVITTIIVVVLIILFANLITNPLKKLIMTADKLTDGDFSVEVPQIKSNDEIQRLSVMTSMLVDTIKFLKKKGGKK